MNRDRNLSRLASGEDWDVIVIGGGATGLGVAVDAATRGYRTALLEAHDFAKGTSSRSTKLVHGGVRYLRSGELGLVRGALHERGLLERHAPHLVGRQTFVIPIYRRIDLPLYGAGLKFYELLSGALSFGPSHTISKEETLRLLPTIRPDGLRGGVVYHDGQFDDARLALALARTAVDRGAAVVNYVRVKRLLKAGGKLSGVEAEDGESGATIEIRGRVVVNAAGVFSDKIRRLDAPKAPARLALSSGVHLVLDQSFLPGGNALMVPRTSDGRVLFAVPWLGKLIVGTTDEPRNAPQAEPRPFEREVAFLMEHASRYLVPKLGLGDIRSVFTGLRPLVSSRGGFPTSRLSRDHRIEVSSSGLLTIVGGKWTTYRKMAEDAVDRAAAVGGLPERDCETEELMLHGSDSTQIEELLWAEPGLGRPIHPEFPYREAEVVWAARREMARTVEDVLARRTRILFLDARAAAAAAPRTAALLARELGRPDSWVATQIREFRELSRSYLPARR